MPFVTRHQQILQKLKPYSIGRLWINSFLLGVALFAAGSLYLYGRRGAFDLFIANKAMAGAAVGLIGLSFALSGLCYFWDFVDTKIIYRKYLGLTGFWFAITHIFTSLFLLPGKFPFPQYYLSRPTLFLFGVIALAILIMMAAISNQYATHELGGKRWRLLLRTGYLALIAVVIHFGTVKYTGWITWLNKREPILPPLSLLIMIFSVIVIGLRIALWLSLRKKSNPNKSQTEQAQQAKD